MQVVTWALRSGNGSGVLTRWAGPVVTSSGALQESWLRTLQFLGNETGQLRTLEGTAQWQIYFFRGNAWSNAQSSADAVAGSTQGILPDGVRLVLTLSSGQALVGNITRDWIRPTVGGGK
jgi:general secretion pathway protein J